MADSSRRRARWFGLLALVVLIALPGCSGDPAADAAELSLQFMLGARSATLDPTAGTLTLTGAEPSVTWFTDRPERLSGRMPTTALVQDWDHLFGDDPPNAGLQSLGAADTDAAVAVELTDAPTDDGAGTLTFPVRPIGQAAADGPLTLQQVSLFIDAGDTATVPQTAEAASTTYSVTVTNQSDQYEQFVIYQQPAASGVADALPLAWLTASAAPRSTVTFQWNDDLSFYWSIVDAVPGASIIPAQMAPADAGVPSNAEIALTSTNGTLSFAPVTNPSPADGLSIVTDATVPANGATIGIAQSNAPVFAVPAEPGRTTTFATTPQYWIAAGLFFLDSQVLDPEAITNTAALPFDGTVALDAVFDVDDHWRVSKPG